MLAIDTNVLVRLLTDDDPEQTVGARALVDSQPVMLLTTVVLESAWVLSAGYGLEKRRIIRALSAFAGLPSVSLEEPERVARALAWAEGGLDIADALHLAAAEDGFATFDRKLKTAAQKLDTPKVHDV